MADDLARIRAATAADAEAQGWLAETVRGLILAALASLLASLERILRLWLAGQMIRRLTDGVTVRDRGGVVEMRMALND